MSKLRFAVIGTGWFGKHYIRLLQGLEGVSLVAIANKTQGNAEAVLADPNIDCVVIATPASTHFGYIKNALQHGKHVLAEKPMVLSSGEAVGVRDLMQKAGKSFMVAHQYLYHDAVHYLREMMARSTLGKVSKMIVECMYPGPIRDDVGVFWDAGPHDLAITDFLCGAVSVIAARGEKWHKAEKAVEDNVKAEMEFTSGFKLDLTLSSTAEKKFRKRTFICEKGIAVFDDSEGMGTLVITSSDGQRLVPEIKIGEPLRNELEHFIYCVRNKKTPLTDVEHGIRVVKNLEWVYKHLNRG